MDVEETLSRELSEVADRLAVPALPTIPQQPPRVRRHLQPLLVAAAVALIVTGAIALVAGNGGGEAPDPAPPPATTTSAAPGPMVALDPDAEIDGTGDTDSLATLPSDFRTFIGRLARRLYADSPRNSGDACSVDATWVRVRGFDPRGYAVGSVGACGSAVAVWARRDDGPWYEVFATQSMWDCEALHQAQVPSSLLGPGRVRCYSYDGDQQEHDYEVD